MHGGTVTNSVHCLKEKDARDLSLLERECFSSAWSEEQYRKLLRHGCGEDGSRVPPCFAYGVRDGGGKLAAYVSLIVDFPDALEVLNIAVRPDARRKGLAWSLLRRALEWGRDKKLARCLLEVREGNGPALALYAKAGFQIQGRRKRYYADTGEDALLLACELQLRRT